MRHWCQKGYFYTTLQGKNIEPIFRFCYKRLSDRCDAEDLAGEIICYILDGMSKYRVESLDAWVWRIAHNRYARFIDARNKAPTVLSCDELFDIADYSDVDEDNTQEQYETVFRYLHTLGAERDEDLWMPVRPI